MVALATGLMLIVEHFFGVLRLIARDR